MLVLNFFGEKQENRARNSLKAHYILDEITFEYLLYSKSHYQNRNFFLFLKFK